MVVTVNSKRKIEKLSTNALEDLAAVTIDDREDEAELEEAYDEENDEDVEEGESEDSEDSDDVDSLDSGDEGKDEFEDGDTSDEEDRRNTIGNVPIEWYDHLPHIGYDLDGKKIARPIKTKDEIDDFLARCEDPNYWKQITDKSTLRNHELTKEEVDFIQRLTAGKHSSHYDDTPEWVDLYSHAPELHPINRAPDSKRSFIPSLDDRAKVNKLALLIRRGIIKTRAQREKERAENEATKFYDVWSASEARSKAQQQRERMAYPAPKLTLPGHAESYRPPPEFVFDEDERLKWEASEPEERRLNFMPAAFPNLRTVPAYKDYLKERFERCLDLYLAPRQRKMKMNVNKEDLIPKLPSPKDLQPFPTFQAILYSGHDGWVRSISIHQSGQYLVSGGDDGTMRVWEVQTGRCLRKIDFGEKVKRVEWCPNCKLYLIAVGVGSRVCLVNPFIGDRRIIDATNQLFDDFDGKENKMWKSSETAGVKLDVVHEAEIIDLVWHSKGDYFGVVSGVASKTDVWFHQISTRQSSRPFSKTKGLVQRIKFHPHRLLFYVATQRWIKVYDLAKQEMQRKLEPNVKWISDFAIHHGGDNIIVGDYSTRLAWIDTDYSMKPFKTLRYHKKAVRSVSFHDKYPLFCSGSDDGSIIVSHGRVYNDLTTEPLIVPVKVLKGIRTTANYGVLDVAWHPNQPWVFGAGVDGTIRLYT